MRFTNTGVRLIALMAGLTLSATACGGGDSGGGSGSGSLSGASIIVGSKEFTESVVLGKIAILALEDAGATVSDKTKITGTANTRKALTSGQVDMYWEYTGTGWTDILGHEVSQAATDEKQLYQDVAAEDLKNGIKWFALSPANDTYAIATTSSNPVKTLSDYAALAKSNPSDASLCAASEFLDRDDGWPGLEKAYGFALPKSNITQVDLGIVFTQVPDQSSCKFGEVFATDGRIPANDMAVVQDDKNFFVHYNVAVTMNSDLYDKYPAVSDILSPIAEKLTTEELQKLNAEVDVDGLPTDAVAEKWLKDNNFI